MIANVGTWDRVVRLILAAALAVAAISGQWIFADPLWFWLGLAVAVVLAVTAVIRFCPLYAPFGISTRRRSS